MKNLEGDPARQHKLIRAMIDGGHALGTHGYDHDPATRKGYLATKPAVVKKDFDDNRTKLEALFAKQKDKFAGFQIARLPGDGRFMKDYVAMIAGELKIAHAGWDFEFAPTSKFAHVTNRDWQGVTGVAGTKTTLPTDRDVVLRHDAHWAGKRAELTALVKKLAGAFSFSVMVPVPGGLKSVQYP
jgi:peptidoglycan/xylan/chitin deacetylase (PgdA/CDA1 family)